MMKIKLNRGPAHSSKRMIVEDGTRNVYIQKPVSPRDLMKTFDDPMVPMVRGEYVRSHRVYKDGTVVFEWMGWMNG